MLFYKHHFYKQHQTETWFEIMAISGRSIVLLQTPYISNEKQCLPPFLYERKIIVEAHPIWITPLFFPKKSWAPFLWFFKNLSSINSRGSHTLLCLSQFLHNALPYSSLWVVSDDQGLKTNVRISGSGYKWRILVWFFCHSAEWLQSIF